MISTLVEHGRTPATVTQEERERRQKAKAKGPRRSDPEPESIDPEEQERALTENQTAATGILDDAVARLIATLEQREEFADALFVVAGTQGDQSGGADQPPGPGFSLHERAVRVPVIVAFPGGAGAARAEDGGVWAPDVTQTIAELTGVTLDAGAEGVSLTQDVAPDRPRFSFSWALLDQMSWKPERSVVRGDHLKIEGNEPLLASRTDPAGEVPAEEAERLASDLASREDPKPMRLPLELAAELLEGTGVSPQPAAVEGRDFGPAALRRAAAVSVWNGRSWSSQGITPKAMIALGRAQRSDPDAKAWLLDRGQLMYMTNNPNASNPLSHAVSLYPTDPEVLHWFAHTLWSDDLEHAERILLAAIEYKTADWDILYDVACSRSLAGDLDASEDYLRQSLEAGFRNWELVNGDADLSNLRDSGRLAAVLREYQQ